jgi:hypothetical protein
VWCHVCEALASTAGEVRAARDSAQRRELFCERCGVALPGGDVASPVQPRLSELARLGVAGVAGVTGGAGRARRPPASGPREG